MKLLQRIGNDDGICSRFKGGALQPHLLFHVLSGADIHGRALDGLLAFYSIRPAEISSHLISPLFEMMRTSIRWCVLVSDFIQP